MRIKFSQIFFFIVLFLCAWGTSGTLMLPMLLMFSTSALAFFFFVNENTEFDLISKKSAIENPFLLSGLTLILLNLLQLINPEMRVYEYYGIQVVDFLNHIKYLPKGIIRDPSYDDTFTALIRILGAWYFAMVCWYILKNKKFAVISLKFFAINGVAMGLLAILQKFTNAQGIFWIIPTNATFYGSFFLVNAACDFLILTTSASFALALLAYQNKNLKKFFIWSVVGAFMIFCILNGTSTGAKGLSLLLVFFYFLFVLWEFWKSKILLSFVCLMSVILGLYFIGYRGMDLTLLESKYKNTQASFDARIRINKISKKIFETSPIYGVGGGAYGVNAEILCPKSSTYSNQTKSFINGAHNDFFEYVCEYGIIGFISILCCFTIWILYIFRSMTFLCSANYILIIALLISGAHSMIDVHLHIFATMLAFVFVMSLCVSQFLESKNV